MLWNLHVTVKKKIKKKKNSRKRRKNDKKNLEKKAFPREEIEEEIGEEDPDDARLRNCRHSERNLERYASLPFRAGVSYTKIYIVDEKWPWLVLSGEKITSICHPCEIFNYRRVRRVFTKRKMKIIFLRQKKEKKNVQMYLKKKKAG